MSRRLYLAWILALAGTPLFPVSFAQDVPLNDRPPAWATPQRPSDAPLSVPGFDKLYSALQEKRSVRVIVRLREPRLVTSGFGSGSDQTGAPGRAVALGRRREEVLQRISWRGAGTAKRFDFIPFMAVEADDNDFWTLLSSPEIDHMEEDVAVRPSLSVSVPLIGGGSDGTFSGYSGSGMAVAILDTGVDASHPFFGGRVVEEACYSTTSGSTVLSTCPNGQDSQTGTGSGVNCDDSPAGCYHGTHVAGIAAGKTTGLSGLAQNATIISIQIFSKFMSEASCGSGMAPCVLSYTSDQILGLQRVYELRDQYSIAAVNMSLGGGLYANYCDSGNEAIKAAIDNLRSVGIATVISSGNGGSSSGISYPACISSAISVGSTTKSDGISSYSNSASIMKLLAPGSFLYSSFPGGIYGDLSGSSMAAPHVSGAWAVIKQKKPSATVDEVLNALTTTGKPITDSRNGLTRPRIKVDAALISITTPSTNILWRNTDGRLLVWNMDGSTFTESTPLNSGAAVNLVWRVTGTGDFNGDGKVDILWRHTDGRLMAWLMNGSAFVRSFYFNSGAAVNTAWSVVGTGDFNGDGKVDILWRHTDGRLLLWFMDGITFVRSFSLNNGIAVNTAWSVAGTGDFNGDGKVDILWRHADGRLLVWFMNGTTFVRSFLLNNGTSVNTAWSVVGTADFMRNGNADILWRHTDGRLLIWYMSGTTFSYSKLLNGGNPVDLAWNVVGAFVP